MLIRPTGKPIKKEELGEIFQALEGGIQAIIGKIGSGKTTEAVRRIMLSLSNGRVVYTNVLLDLSSTQFDDRDSAYRILKGLIFPFSKLYFKFERKNYNYFNPITGGNEYWIDPSKLKKGAKQHKLAKQYFDPEDPECIVKWLNSLTDCEIYFDEGQRILNSYEGTRISKDKASLVEETRHVNRLLVIITQRANRIHVNARGNINQFFVCSKDYSWLPYIIFPSVKYYVTEYQDMIGTEIDLDMPMQVKKYTKAKNASVWRLFNTHYLRNGRPKTQEVFFEAYEMSYKEKILTLVYFVISFYRMIKNEIVDIYRTYKNKNVS